jgi:hypothetical protein
VARRHENKGVVTAHSDNRAVWRWDRYNAYHCRAHEGVGGATDYERSANRIDPKGQIPVEMERRLREAASTGVGVLIVRAGDFFGPKAGNNWLSQGLIKAGKPVSGIA